MKRLAILLAVMGALVCAPAAQAASRIVTGPAVEETSTRPPLPSPMPAVVSAACPDERVDETRNPGCYVAKTYTLYIALSGTDRVFVYWHEMGHAFDQTMLSPGERARFARYVGMTGRTWWGEPGKASPAEFFADAYANCALGQRPVNGEFTVGYGYAPESNEENESVCRFISRAGGATRATPKPRHSSPETPRPRRRR